MTTHDSDTLGKLLAQRARGGLSIVDGDLDDHCVHAVPPWSVSAGRTHSKRATAVG
jgi:hypothetical protein